MKRVALLMALAVLGAPPIANAATVESISYSVSFDFGLFYESAPGERDDLRLTIQSTDAVGPAALTEINHGGDVAVVEPRTAGVPLTSETCAIIDAKAFCTSAVFENESSGGPGVGASPWRDSYVYLGDGDDRIEIRGRKFGRPGYVGVPLHVNGNDGHDVIDARSEILTFVSCGLGDDTVYLGVSTGTDGTCEHELQ